jgi:hypothetical protein
VSDFDGFEPLCGETEFTAMLEDVALTSAPRVFAVVQEFGERVDGWVAAWGFAFEDRAEVVAVDDRSRMTLQEPERAVHLFSSKRRHLRARLVWLPGIGERDEEDAGVAAGSL